MRDDDMPNDEKERFQAKWAKLEARVNTMERVVDELRSGLMGNSTSIGALELIRATNKSVASLERSFEAETVLNRDGRERAKKDRWTIGGVIMALIFFGKLGSWLMPIVFSGLKGP